MNARQPLIASLILFCACHTAAAGILVDFGATAATPTLGGAWNELARSETGSVALLDASGAATGVTLSWVGFQGTGLSNQTAWSADKLWVDDVATGDTFNTVGSTTEDSIVTISGLSNLTNYRIDLVASRSSGPASARVSDYQINGLFADSIPNGDDFSAYSDGYLDQSILSWNSVAVNGDGDIVLTIDEPISSFGYLTALQISNVSQVPAPSSLALAGLGFLWLAAARRRRRSGIRQRAADH